MEDSSVRNQNLSAYQSRHSNNNSRTDNNKSQTRSKFKADMLTSVGFTAAKQSQALADTKDEEMFSRQSQSENDGEPTIPRNKEQRNFQSGSIDNNSGGGFDADRGTTDLDRSPFRNKTGMSDVEQSVNPLRRGTFGSQNPTQDLGTNQWQAPGSVANMETEEDQQSEGNEEEDFQSPGSAKNTNLYKKEMATNAVPGFKSILNSRKTSKSGSPSKINKMDAKSLFNTDGPRTGMPPKSKQKLINSDLPGQGLPIYEQMQRSAVVEEKQEAKLNHQPVISDVGRWNHQTGSSQFGLAGHNSGGPYAHQTNPNPFAIGQGHFGGQSAPFSKAGSGSDESPDRIKIMEVLPPIDQPKKKFTPAKAKLSPKQQQQLNLATLRANQNVELGANKGLVQMLENRLQYALQELDNATLSSQKAVFDADMAKSDRNQLLMKINQLTSDLKSFSMRATQAEQKLAHNNFTLSNFAEEKADIIKKYNEEKLKASRAERQLQWELSCRDKDHQEILDLQEYVAEYEDEKKVLIAEITQLSKMGNGKQPYAHASKQEKRQPSPTVKKQKQADSPESDKKKQRAVQNKSPDRHSSLQSIPEEGTNIERVDTLENRLIQQKIKVKKADDYSRAYQESARKKDEECKKQKTEIQGLEKKLEEEQVTKEKEKKKLMSRDNKINVLEERIVEMQKLLGIQAQEQEQEDQPVEAAVKKAPASRFTRESPIKTIKKIPTGERVASNSVKQKTILRIPKNQVEYQSLNSIQKPHEVSLNSLMSKLGSGTERKNSQSPPMKQLNNMPRNDVFPKTFSQHRSQQIVTQSSIKTGTKGKAMTGMNSDLPQAPYTPDQPKLDLKDYLSPKPDDYLPDPEFRAKDFKGRKPAMDYDVASAGSSDEEEDPKAFGFETGVQKPQAEPSTNQDTTSVAQKAPVQAQQITKQTPTRPLPENMLHKLMEQEVTNEVKQEVKLQEKGGYVEPEEHEISVPIKAKKIETEKPKEEPEISAPVQTKNIEPKEQEISVPVKAKPIAPPTQEEFLENRRKFVDGGAGQGSVGSGEEFQEYDEPI